ncbi:MAG: hypothetical protein BGO77_02915 [Caedibacter sp. 37-49]|nr:MAG: hypothetical protein BGO77_02915 [Caedibacter sp. 37-49]
MNKITIVAFIFLFLHFMIKPMAHTFPTLETAEIEQENPSKSMFYEAVGTFQEPNSYEPLDEFINQFEDTKEQEQSYI